MEFLRTTILERINSPRKRSYTKEIVVEPELIVRGTTMAEAAKAVHL
jgi:DNA-binding LacI/PurR family transcriptional regulator